jgi:hypothetical protein
MPRIPRLPITRPGDGLLSIAVTVVTMPEPPSSTLFQHTPKTDHDEAGILITLRWNQ